MDILYIKALHIIFVVTWFAGLFYIVRLFVYHAEAENKEEPERSILLKQFKIMERRLWYGITWPSMIATYVFGFWLLYVLYGFLVPGWLILKLSLVLLLTLYHIRCGVMFGNLQRDKKKYSSFVLRLWNEVATLFLVAIVFLVELRGEGKWWWGVVGLLIFAALMTLAVFLYKKRREISNKKIPG